MKQNQLLILSSTQLAQYHQDGYVILPQFFSDEILAPLEQAMLSCLALQAMKIRKLQGKLPFQKISDYKTVEHLDELLMLFEKHDTNAAQEAAVIATYTRANHQFLANKHLVCAAADALDCPEEFVLIPETYPSCLVNLPAHSSDKRLLYRWHSETSYIPGRNNFLTGWFPLFRDKIENNGTMLICPKSQDNTLGYSVFRGYDQDSRDKKNASLQLAIDERQLKSYEQVPMLCRRGDLVLFNSNLIHSSSLNQTDLPSYTGIMRIFDYSKDLLSTNQAILSPTQLKENLSDAIVPVNFT